MTHLTIEQLLQIREPGREPGVADARDHLNACPACQAELDRLGQRVARLKALPTLRPSRDLWSAVRQRVNTHRARRRRIGVALALAASGLAVVIGRNLSVQPASAATEISQAMTRSHELEGALDSFDPDSRVTDGLTARVAGELEDRIAAIDRNLEMAELLGEEAREQALLKLWRERVGLLDALVDVHLTRASNVGL